LAQTGGAPEVIRRLIEMGFGETGQAMTLSNFLAEAGSQIDAPMIWAAQHALWDLITMMVVVPSAIGLAAIFWAKRRVRSLNFFITCLRDETDFPLKVYVEVRNYTGCSVVISDPYFVYGHLLLLRPDPNARGHIPAGEYEIKFPDPRNQELSEVEYLIRYLGEGVLSPLG
jgi:hypothetical protein